MPRTAKEQDAMANGRLDPVHGRFDPITGKYADGTWGWSRGPLTPCEVRNMRSMEKRILWGMTDRRDFAVLKDRFEKYGTRPDYAFDDPRVRDS